MQNQGVGVQQEQAQQQAAGQIPAPAPQLAPMTPHSQVTQPVIPRTLGQTSAYISPLPTVSQAPTATAGHGQEPGRRLQKRRCSVDSSC